MKDYCLEGWAGFGFIEHKEEEEKGTVGRKKREKVCKQKESMFREL